MTQTDPRPHRLLPPLEPETTTLEMGPMLRTSSPAFSLRPVSMRRIPPALQEMIAEEAKAEGKRRKRR